MIESALYFALGFVCAAFLALLLIPALLRRTARLTRRRIEASLPLSRDEIIADKDRLRAEHAVATRKLEITLKSVREKSALQAVEIARASETIDALDKDKARMSARIDELEKALSGAEALAGGRGNELSDLVARLEQAQSAMDEQARAIERLTYEHDEISIIASSRQIEIVAREAEIDKLSEQLGVARSQRKDAERRAREAGAEARALRDTLKAERRKNADTDEKLQRMIAEMTDEEDRLERRERKLGRLQDQVKELTAAREAAERELAESRSQRARLEKDLDSSLRQMSSLVAGATAGDIADAMKRVSAERDRLQERLSTILAENRKLRDEVAADPARGGDEALRERIGQLAAEVVHLTSLIDDEGSPIGALVGAAPASAAGSQPAKLSLADRVRALQAAAHKEDSVAPPPQRAPSVQALSAPEPVQGDR